MSGFDFVRTGDGLVYSFRPERELAHGRVSFRRDDGAAWCRWQPGCGWCVCDAEGRPHAWPVDPADADTPPTGLWQSLKLGKTYTYELRLEADPGPG